MSTYCRAPFSIACEGHSPPHSGLEEFCAGQDGQAPPEMLYLTITTPQNKWRVSVPREKIEAVFDAVRSQGIEIEF